ncbi:MAG: DUF2442 domain-containing protein [Sedimenticola sp.]
MLLDIISVRPLPNYQLALEFENGEHRKFDMRPLLLMKPWDKITSQSMFQQAKAEYGTVVWPNEIDIAPETLYDNSVPSNS